VFHAPGKGPVSWYGFALAIMEGAAKRGARSAAVVPISAADYPTRARRPANSVLDCSRLLAVHGIEMPPWQSSLDATLNDILLSPPHPTGEQS
jgi:dTDP-4-dehydrorhamnose reductase